MIEESHELKYSILEVKIPRIVLNMALWTLSRTNDILGLTISSNILQMLHQFLCCMLFCVIFQRKGAISNYIQSTLLSDSLVQSIHCV